MCIRMLNFRPCAYHRCPTVLWTGFFFLFFFVGSFITSDKLSLSFTQLSTPLFCNFTIAVSAVFAPFLACLLLSWYLWVIIFAYHLHTVQINVYAHSCTLFPPVCQKRLTVALETVSTRKPTTSKHIFCLLMLTYNV